MEASNDKNIIENELNEAQKKFCEEYIYDFNGTRSYKVAYPNCKSDNAAGVNSYDLLRLTKIQQYIKHLQNNLSEVSGITKLKQLKRLNKIAENEKEQVSARIKADEVLAKMLGHNEPEKVDMKNNILLDKDPFAKIRENIGLNETEK